MRLEGFGDVFFRGFFKLTIYVFGVVAVEEVKEVWRKEGIDILDVQEDGEGIRIERF